MIPGRKPESITTRADAIRECKRRIVLADRDASRAKKYEAKYRAVGRAKAYRVALRWLSKIGGSLPGV